MARLNCSRHLRHALGLDVETGLPGDLPQPVSENRLGEWAATVLMLPPARLVLAVSEYAQLPVVVDLEPRASFLERLPEAIYQSLLDLDIPADLARRERDALLPLKPATGDNRSGTFAALRLFAVELKSAWDHGLSRSPAELGRHLATLETIAEDGPTPAQSARRRFHLLPDQTDVFGL